LPRPTPPRAPYARFIAVHASSAATRFALSSSAQLMRVAMLPPGADVLAAVPGASVFLSSPSPRY